eukprot:CAMPEP_0181303174 /NCGR_PEP_ID=MMETSP1101-20121128/8407_1 /TAXON_ID=46948 /ORGANISM="Rhodomonas abbreviata, Strain Caron Lab Isolate" /LENGTH=321 /DNA_ID=CAMNT_0023408709 /DNA_START=32 /DNA_END=993 /DNA_ORIENTATION=+
MKHSIPRFILAVAVPAVCAFSPTTPSLPAYNNLRTSLSPHVRPTSLRGGASILAARSIHGEESQSGGWAKDLGIEVPRLLKPDGTSVITEQALKGKYVGLYFSAHWCPPCRRFTPILSQTYNAILQSRPDFEVVFVSGDRDQEAFDEYFASMPWLAVPYSQDTTQLEAKYAVEGFPTLVVIGPDGSVVNPDAVDRAEEDSHGKQFPWGKQVTSVAIGSEGQDQMSKERKSMMDKLAGEEVVFEAANKYGMSAVWMHEGEQLANTRAHDDKFRVHRVGDGVYQLESISAPGLFLGVGPRHSEWYPNNGFKATLMPRSSRCDL